MTAKERQRLDVFVASGGIYAATAGLINVVLSAIALGSAYRPESPISLEVTGSLVSLGTNSLIDSVLPGIAFGLVTSSFLRWRTLARQPYLLLPAIAALVQMAVAFLGIRADAFDREFQSSVRIALEAAVPGLLLGMIASGVVLLLPPPATAAPLASSEPPPEAG